MSSLRKRWFKENMNYAILYYAKKLLKNIHFTEMRVWTEISNFEKHYVYRKRPDLAKICLGYWTILRNSDFATTIRIFSQFNC